MPKVRTKPKKLVVCCDGTWNTAASATNIRKTFEFLSKELENSAKNNEGESEIVEGWTKLGERVILYYDTGVGTGKWSKWLGGLTGLGLSANIMQAYAFISKNYAPNDEIFAFLIIQNCHPAMTNRYDLGLACSAAHISRSVRVSSW